MRRLTDQMISRGWAWRVPKDRPHVAVLVPPAEQSSLGHDLRYSIPKGDEEQVRFEERRRYDRGCIQPNAAAMFSTLLDVADGGRG